MNYDHVTTSNNKEKYEPGDVAYKRNMLYNEHEWCMQSDEKLWWHIAVGWMQKKRIWRFIYEKNATVGINEKEVYYAIMKRK